MNKQIFRMFLPQSEKQTRTGIVVCLAVRLAAALMIPRGKLDR